MSHNTQLLAAAKAQDLYDLQTHIAWTDILQPKLREQVALYSAMLVAEALGTPQPGGLTREQIAGRAYGIQYVLTLFERILKEGERAVAALENEGIKLTT
jgi:hypothetical protein